MSGADKLFPYSRRVSLLKGVGVSYEAENLVRIMQNQPLTFASIFECTQTRRSWKENLSASERPVDWTAEMDTPFEEEKGRLQGLKVASRSG